MGKMPRCKTGNELNGLCCAGQAVPEDSVMLIFVFIPCCLRSKQCPENEHFQRHVGHAEIFVPAGEAVAVKLRCCAIECAAFPLGESCPERFNSHEKI